MINKKGSLTYRNKTNNNKSGSSAHQSQLQPNFIQGAHNHRQGHSNWPGMAGRNMGNSRERLGLQGVNSQAAGLDKPVIYVGSKTGRDGIHGASMASAIFDDKIEEKKPTVQVGDPSTEKLLLGACLELMADNSIIAIQDMGAAGLTSSSIEMASKETLELKLI